MLDLYNERAPLFEKYADIIIDYNGTAFAKYKAEGIKKIEEYLNKTGQK